jgi:hypothetical protein
MPRRTFPRLRRRTVLLAVALALLAVAVPIALASSYSTTGSITAGDPTQMGRLLRDAIVSACGTAKPNPGAFGDATPRHYDKYTFQNGDPATQCETITINAMTCTSGSNELFSGAYTPSFNPANITANYLGDIGASAPVSTSYGVDVGSRATFDTVVNEVTANGGCPAYGITIAGTNLVPQATIPNSSSITAGDATQTGRLFRDDPPSTCTFFPSESVIASTGNHYDKYAYRNTAAIWECMTITFDPMTCTGSTALQSGAYTPSFNPANPLQNILGDIGNSPTSVKAYSVRVPAGANFDVTVNEVTAGSGCPGYSLIVSGFGLTANNPTAAGVVSFDASRSPAGVALRWRTGSEAGTVGYNLFRVRRGDRVRVNAKLLPAQQRAGVHLYSFVDRKGGASRYWLQRVSLDGSRDWVASAQVR